MIQVRESKYIVHKDFPSEYDGTLSNKKMLKLLTIYASKTTLLQMENNA